MPFYFILLTEQKGFGTHTLKYLLCWSVWDISPGTLPIGNKCLMIGAIYFGGLVAAIELNTAPLLDLVVDFKCQHWWKVRQELVSARLTVRRKGKKREGRKVLIIELWGLQ